MSVVEYVREWDIRYACVGFFAYYIIASAWLYKYVLIPSELIADREAVKIDPASKVGALYFLGKFKFLENFWDRNFSFVHPHAQQRMDSLESL